MMNGKQVITIEAHPWDRGTHTDDFEIPVTVDIQQA